MGPKIWTPWGSRKKKTIRRTPKRGPDFAPHFRVHIAHVFRSVTPEKIMLCRMFVSRFLVLTTTCPGTGEDRADFFWSIAALIVTIVAGNVPESLVIGRFKSQLSEWLKRKTNIQTTTPTHPKHQQKPAKQKTNKTNQRVRQ